MTLRIGDTVQVSERIHTTQIGGWGTGINFYPNTDYEVTRLGSSKVVIRGTPGSGWVEMANLVGFDGAVDAPRKLGTPPDDGGDYISPDDPRLAWLWADAAKYAEQQGYCPTYDTICARLGIPGRPRDFSVTGMVDGLSIAVSVRALSPKLAVEQVTAKISGLTGARAA